MDATTQGTARANKLKNRGHAKTVELNQIQRIAEMQGLTKNEYWERYVKSQEDIVRFYQLYYPDYPEILAKSIAARISGIVEKSRRGEKLSEDEKDYYRRSQTESKVWNPLEDLKNQELAGKVQLAVKNLEGLSMSMSQ